MRPARSWSNTENRQVRILPSEVMRTRLQCPQKGCETGAMMPISPMPSSNLITPRRLAALVLDLDQRPELCHLLEDLFERDHHFRRPHAVFFQRHEFDEAQHHAFFACELSEGDDLVFVESAQQHAIHLYRIKSRRFRGADSGEAAFISVLHARDARELFGIHRVHAHRNASQPGIFQWLRHLRQ